MQETYYLASGSIQPSLRFHARSAKVDNGSGNWLYVAETGEYVPPLTFGRVMVYRPAIQTPNVRVQTPPGQLSAGGGVAAVIVFSSEELSSDAGLLVTSPQALTPLTAGPTTSPAAASFSLDFGTLSSGLWTIQSVTVSLVKAGATDYTFQWSLKFGATVLALGSGSTMTPQLFIPSGFNVQSTGVEHVTVLFTATNPVNFGLGDVSASGTIVYKAAT